MSLLSKANKRSCYPVKFEDRTVYVRSLTCGELRRMNALHKDLRTPFVVGISVVTEDGAPEVAKILVPVINEKEQPEAYAAMLAAGSEAQLRPETDDEFALRCEQLQDSAGVDTEIVSKLTDAIANIGKVTVETVKDIEKN